MKPNNKTTITFQVTAAEKAKLNQTAQELNISLSKFVRNRALLDSQQIQKLEKDNQRLKAENEKLQCISGIQLSSDEYKGIILKFTQPQIELLTYIYADFTLREIDKPLTNTTFDDTIKQCIFEAIKDNLHITANQKDPDNELGNDIEDEFEEMID